MTFQGMCIGIAIWVVVTFILDRIFKKLAGGK